MDKKLDAIDARLIDNRVSKEMDRFDQKIRSILIIEQSPAMIANDDDLRSSIYPCCSQ